MNIALTLPDATMQRLRAYGDAQGPEGRATMMSWLTHTIVQAVNTLEPVKVTAPYGTSTRVEFENNR